jgi:pSer/pThr/pTyr-binding forkhead associated (FHA) protein
MEKLSTTQPIPNSYFNGEQHTINIGRFYTCELQIEDSLLSKYQAQITYAETQGWVLTDGHNGKSSTNGTW